MHSVKKISVIGILFLFISLSIPLFAAPGTEKIPATPAGKRMKEIIGVINKGDRQQWVNYAKLNFTEEYFKKKTVQQHKNDLSWVYDTWGPFQYKDNFTSEEFLIAAKFYSPVTEYWIKAQVEVEKSSPHKIKGIRIGRMSTPDFARPKKIIDAQIVQELKTFLEKVSKHDRFSGTVLLAKKGNVLFKGAYGQASKRFDVANRIDTKFNLGSMNKMFTSVAIAQLVEKGKLSFDDTIDKYVDESWLKPEITKQIKIKHLLTHTSGLGSYFNKTFMESSRLRFRKVDDYKILVKDEKLRFTPGSKWRYSNTGMFLLGVVIEKVTGQSYFDYILENIHKPAGMINSDCYAMDRPIPNLAIGYTKRYTDNGFYWRNNIYDHVVKGGPAGGGFSTVEDLLKFAMALEQHKLLSQKFTDLVMSPKPELNSPEYGYGFGVGAEGDDFVAGHSGGFTGINSTLQIFRKSGYVFAIMSNYDSGMSLVKAKLYPMLTAKKE